MDREVSEDTRLLYCTTGVLLQKLINDKNMHRFTHVILDEVTAVCLVTCLCDDCEMKHISRQLYLSPIPA